MTELDLQRFSSVARLYGLETLHRFFGAHVAVVGIGGVGSWVCEGLARSGVGKVTLVDLDDLCLTNTNRQIHALDSTIGKQKTTVMAERMRQISPSGYFESLHRFYTEDFAEEFFRHPYSAVVDAIDSVRPKVHLIANCHQRRIPIVTSGGAGGRIDPRQIRVSDLAQSHGCALLQRVRKKLRTDFSFPSNESNDAFDIKAVFSCEQPRFPTPDGCTSIERPSGLPTGLKCDAGFGTAAHVTSCFGFHLVSCVLKTLAKKTDT